MTRRPRRPSSAARLAVAAPLLVVALAACGGSASTTTAAPSGDGAAARSAGGAAPSGSGQRQQPGVSGQTAEISGDTLQVRTADGQTAVQFTAATRITQVQAATAAAVTVGSCLVATGEPDAAGTGLAAQTVAVSPATAEGCTADTGPGGRGFGAGPSGGRGTRTAPPGQDGSGDPRPSGQGGPGGQDGTGGPATPVSTAVGTVTAVTPTSVTVQGLLRTFSRTARPASPGASPTGSPAKVTVTVTLASTTRFTSTVTVKASALAVGQCVTALGPANDIGVVAARSLTIRAASADGTCATGFGGFGGRRGNGATASSSGATNG